MIKISMDWFSTERFKRTCCFRSSSYNECFEYVSEQLEIADFDEAESGIYEYYVRGEINSIEKYQLELKVAQWRYDFHAYCESDFEKWQKRFAN